MISVFSWLRFRDLLHLLGFLAILAWCGVDVFRSASTTDLLFGMVALPVAWAAGRVIGRLVLPVAFDLISPTLAERVAAAATVLVFLVILAYLALGVPLTVLGGESMVAAVLFTVALRWRPLWPRRPAASEPTKKSTPSSKPKPPEAASKPKGPEAEVSLSSAELTA